MYQISCTISASSGSGKSNYNFKCITFFHPKSEEFMNEVIEGFCKTFNMHELSVGAVEDVKIITACEGCIYDKGGQKWHEQHPDGCLHMPSSCLYCVQ